MIGEFRMPRRRVRPALGSSSWARYRTHNCLGTRPCACACAVSTSSERNRAARTNGRRLLRIESAGMLLLNSVIRTVVVGERGAVLRRSGVTTCGVTPPDLARHQRGETRHTRLHEAERPQIRSTPLLET
jgi:hypothetical protein